MDIKSPDVFHLPPFIAVIGGIFLASEIAARKFFKFYSNRLDGIAVWRDCDLLVTGVGTGMLLTSPTCTKQFGSTSTQKGTHRAFIEIFLKNSTSLGQPEPPTVASNEAAGAVRSVPE